MTTQPARGMRDFLPDDLRRREYVVGVVRDVYERYGFEPLETPAVENLDTLLGKYGEEGNKLIFKILKRGEHEASGQADLALRYDLTVPLARVIAEYQATLPKFFKRYQIQPVWRADRPARGRFREFYQCDIDTIGSASPVVEVEQLSAVSEILKELGFQDFIIRVNHRQVLSTLLTNAFVPPEQHSLVLVVLDKMDKIGPDGVAKELADEGVPDDVRNRLLSWIGAAFRPDWLNWLKRQFTIMDGPGEAGFENLREIVELSAQTAAADKLRFDPSLARGLAYYTGAIMEINVPDMAGSLGGGGRYDNLIGTFLGRDVPACGFSLGLERILVVMSERKMLPESVVRGASDVMVTLWNSETRGDSLALATSLRAAGLRVDVYPEPDKIGKQFKYASGRKVPFVAVVGDDERKNGTVTIKDMRTGEQVTQPRAGAGQYLKQRAMSNEQRDPDLKVDEGL